MSIHVISDVLRHSQAKLGTRLVLIVLADHAKRDGTGAWPSVATIADEANLSERAVQRALRELEAAGEVVSQGPHPEHGTTVWDVLVGGAKSAPPGGDNSAPGGVTNGTSAHAHGGAKSAPKPSDSQPSITRESAPLCFLLADLLEGIGVKRPTITESWAVAERRMVEIDGRDIGTAGELLRWLFISPEEAAAFWRGNILSLPTFRRRYDQLELQRQRSRPLTGQQLRDGLAGVSHDV